MFNYTWQREQQEASNQPPTPPLPRKNRKMKHTGMQTGSKTLLLESGRVSEQLLPGPPPPLLSRTWSC